MLTYGRKIIKLRLIKSVGVIKYVNVEEKRFYKYCFYITKFKYHLCYYLNLFAILAKGSVR